jgi:anti-sigma-K factor RskA
MNVPAELINRCLPAADRPSLRSRLPGWRPTLLALAASLALLLAGAAGWVLREATQSDVAAFLGIAPQTHKKKEKVTTPDWRTKVWSR